MKRFLITGGTGTLGRKLTPLLQNAGYTVRILSRGPRKAGFTPEIEWAQGALVSGQGLAEAVQDVDTIIHAASSPLGKKVELDGARNLLAAAKNAAVGHLLYISIVGVDTHPFAYYRTKLAAEKIIQAGEIPWTILRATQFHELLDQIFLPPLMKLPIAFVPTDFKFQVIDVSEVATRLVELIQTGPSGQAPDIGGPQVRTMGELAESWLRARGLQKKIVHFPMPGAAARAFRNGINTCPDAKYGKITWEEYLSQIDV